LAEEAWTGLANVPREGERARVGWAGARQHLDDLASVVAVIQRTYRVIDWVFFGMCPPTLRRYAAEVHDMVPIGDYPAMLASLGLDAAIAPLVEHPFNRAKSDLKILEYGVLGIPVVASDVGPYRATPALRVDTLDGWIDAVRALAHDRDAAAARGRELREWVLTHRMLAQMLRHWRRALGNER
jgi:glycosyltransferase involved in cell wall biosynthesis